MERLVFFILIYCNKLKLPNILKSKFKFWLKIVIFQYRFYFNFKTTYNGKKGVSLVGFGDVFLFEFMIILWKFIRKYPNSNVFCLSRNF